MTEHADKLVVAASVLNELQAGLLIAALKEHGIEAIAEGGLTAGFRAEAPGDVRVMVRAADLEDASRVMIEYRRAVAEIDWSQVDLGDPE